MATPSASERAPAAFNLTARTSRVELRGADAHDLLNRLSATDLAPLEPDAPPIPALLTDERGRIIAAFAAIRPSPQRLILALHAPDPAPFIEAIAKYTILEDAECADISAQHSHIAIIGTGARELANAVPNSIPAPHCHGQAAPDRADLLVERAAAPAALEHLAAAGCPQAEQDQYEALRIQRGWPEAGAELTSDYNPLEAGLRHLISFTKGCYTGQEVIARLDTYSKVQRRLTRLTASAAAGAAVQIAGQDAGVVTSAADGHALAYIKIRALEGQGGAPITVDGAPAAITAPETPPVQ